MSELKIVKDFFKETPPIIKSALVIFIVILGGLKYLFPEDERLIPLMFMTIILAIGVFITFHIKVKSDTNIKILENKKLEAEEEIKKLENRIKVVCLSTGENLSNIERYLSNLKTNENTNNLIDFDAKRLIELEIQNIHELIKHYDEPKLKQDADTMIKSANLANQS